MKKKLFLTVAVIFIYSFFLVSVSIANDDGLISKFLKLLGLQSSTEQVTEGNQGETDGGTIQPCDTDPIPEPPYPPPPPGGGG